MTPNKKALQQLRRVALGIPAGKLDMSTYARAGDTDTPACLAAWAARDAWFASKGYHLVEVTRPPEGDGTQARYYSIPRYEERNGVVANQRLFGLSPQREQWLLGTPGGKKKPTTADLIAKIDKILVDKPEEPPAPVAA